MHREQPRRHEAPARLFFSVNYALLRHPHSWSTVPISTRTTIPFMREADDECRETDEQVYDVLNRRPRADEEVHNVPIAAGPVPYRNETPVEAAHDKEDKRDTMESLHVV